MLAAADDGGVPDLIAELQRMFPAYALRFAAAGDTMISVSVHPHVDADDVAAVIEAWLGADVDDPDEGLAIGPVAVSEVGVPLHPGA